MKTILLYTAALFAVSSALPFYEKLRNQQTSNLCVSLSYSPSSDTALTYVHVCNTPGEGTCILSFIPRCTQESMKNPTRMTATIGGVDHEVLFSTATCEPGVCFYSMVSDCQCNRYPCPCEGTTTPLPTSPPTSPPTTPPTTTPPPTTPPTTTPPTTTPPTTTPPTTTPPTTTPPPTTPPTTTPPTTTPPTTTPTPPTTTPTGPRVTSPPTTQSPLTTIPPTTPPCQVSADIYFVIDSTRSMGQNGLNVLQSWMVNFVDEFDIGSGNNPRPGVTRIGVVEFWAEGYFYPFTRRSEVPTVLGDYNDKADLINKINALQYNDGKATYIESGLEKLLVANQFGVNIIAGRQRIAILVSDGQEETSLPDAKVSRQWMIGNATEIKNRGIQIFAIGYGEAVNRQNLDIIASNEGDVFTTDKPLSNEVLNRFYNRLVTQICPEAPTRSVSSSARVSEGCFCSVTNGIEECSPPGCKANVNSACRCMTLQSGEKLCDPVGCYSLTERNQMQDKEKLEEDILKAVEIILAKEQPG